MFKSIMTATILALSLSAGVASAAVHVPPAIHVMKTADGKIFTDAKGMTLYIA